MKVPVVLFFLIACAVAKPSPEKYTTKYDNMDIDEILNSDRLLKNYANCLLDKGPCTAEGTELKKNLPDAMKTECAKCSEKQRENSRKVLEFVVKNKRDLFDEVAKMYDPEGKWKEHYCNKAKEENADTHGVC